MPILPILRILLFSAGYKFANISDRQNVTNVVKKYVKKLSVNDKFQGPQSGIYDSEGSEGDNVA